MQSKRFSKIIPRFQNKKISIIFCFLIVLILLISQMVHAHATGPNDTIAVEPETGTINGQVTIGTDQTASNGQFITFTNVISPTPTPISQLIISNLTISDTKNAPKYSLQTNLQTGNTLFGDRSYVITFISPSLQGSQWIRMANNSKMWNMNTTLMSFQVNKSTTIFIGIDQRVAKPGWIDATWGASGLKLTDNEKHPISFLFFQKTFPTGTVNLGPNNGGANSNMYIVIAQ